jgi:hypothetical protein
MSTRPLLHLACPSLMMQLYVAVRMQVQKTHAPSHSSMARWSIIAHSVHLARPPWLPNYTSMVECPKICTLHTYLRMEIDKLARMKHLCCRAHTLHSVAAVPLEPPHPRRASCTLPYVVFCPFLAITLAGRALHYGMVALTVTSQPQPLTAAFIAQIWPDLVGLARTALSDQLSGRLTDRCQTEITWLP